MNAPAIITAPYARLSTSVTPNCSVKPTEAMARTEAVTSPNPTEARKSDTSGSPPATQPRRSSGQGPELRRRQVSDDVDLAGRAVGVDLEDPGRVVVAIEVRRAARTLVPDGLAALERRRALGERVAHLRARHSVTDLEDVRAVRAGAGALRHEHGQRGQVDPVVEVNAARRAQVRGEVAGGTGDLALLRQQRLGEGLVGRTGRLDHQVVGTEVRGELRGTHGRGGGFEERGRDGGRRPDDRD